MSLSRTAALAAVAALKKRGLIAQDASNEEAERVIHNSTETGDRRHPDAARDALRRAGDAAEIDDDTIGELLETLCETHPEIVAQMAREVGQDGRPRRWAKDRREMRMSRDRLMTSRARKFGRDFGPPGVGRESETPEIEQFAGNRNWEENGHGTPAEDRRRGRAFDLAMDQGDSQDAFANWLPGAASIIRG